MPILRDKSITQRYKPVGLALFNSEFKVQLQLKHTICALGFRVEGTYTGAPFCCSQTVLLSSFSVVKHMGWRWLEATVCTPRIAKKAYDRICVKFCTVYEVVSLHLL